MKNLDVKKLREEMGMTQEELAKALEVNARTVQKWEGGESLPRPGTVFMLKAIHENRTKGVSVDGQTAKYNLVNERASQIGMQFSKAEVIAYLAQDWRGYVDIPRFQKLIKVICKKLDYETDLMRELVDLKKQLSDLNDNLKSNSRK